MVALADKLLDILVMCIAVNVEVVIVNDSREINVYSKIWNHECPGDKKGVLCLVGEAE